MTSFLCLITSSFFRLSFPSWTLQVPCRCHDRGIEELFISSADLKVRIFFFCVKADVSPVTEYPHCSPNLLGWVFSHKRCTITNTLAKPRCSLAVIQSVFLQACGADLPTHSTHQRQTIKRLLNRRHFWTVSLQKSNPLLEYHRHRCTLAKLHRVSSYIPWRGFSRLGTLVPSLFPVAPLPIFFFSTGMRYASLWPTRYLEIRGVLHRFKALVTSRLTRCGAFFVYIQSHPRIYNTFKQGACIRKFVLLP
jgi:hypothetical protein